MRQQYIYLLIYKRECHAKSHLRERAISSLVWGNLANSRSAWGYLNVCNGMLSHNDFQRMKCKFLWHKSILILDIEFQSSVRT